MKRTQLYLNEAVWKKLHIRARQKKTSLSELVRQAVGEKYGEPSADRKQAMMSVVGLWRDRKDLPETEKYIRRLRKGKRRKKILS
ncbi:MAG TPA: CopG family transcriptional regulator [Candidatus Acidoferrum sp.]|nr:CopG family transcriptional regulator [Candidatus Acidoferrum sp.]